MELLGADRSAARRQVIVMAVLAVLLVAPAYYLLPWEGAAAHVGAVVVGAALGLVVARARAGRYEQSLRSTWTQWMRYSVASESIPEIYRRVGGKSSRNLPYRFAIVLLVAWAVEVLLLVLAFRDETSAVMAVPAIAYNGLLAGGLLGYFIHRGRWTREFSASVRELVESGEIGLWGVL
jgi:membrane associated rhomboid family serine protease